MRPHHLITSLAAAITLASPGQEPASPVAEIDFLTTEIGQQAKALLTTKAIDWKSVREEFLAAAAQVQTDADQYALVRRLMARLQDGHAGILRSTVKGPDESKGRRYTGPRVHLILIGEKVLIRSAFKDAAEAGLRAGQEVLRIDGQPALEWLNTKAAEMQRQGSGFSTKQQALYSACHWGLADWEGTPIVFEVKDESGAEKSVKRIRNGGPNFAPYGPLFPPKDLGFVGRQSFGKTASGFGYIHLRDIPDSLPIQLDQMLEKIGQVPGLILDMRANGGGGCDHAAVFSRFLAKGQQWGYYEGKSDHPFTGPIVVIVDAGVRSAGETVAGMFKEDGRAYMIGDSPTAGMSSQKSEITTPGGRFTVRFSVHSNMGRFNKGRGIEGIGVLPHEIVPVKSEDLLQDHDTLIIRAEELLKSGFPEDIVDYTGPAAK